MSHVDEGALHAYLDGALDEYPPGEARRVREHVEACAVCAAKLAEERKVREEAHAILGFAAPEVVAPTLEELRAYVRASRPARTSISMQIYRMGWAASVVLALGTGWMLRGGEAVPTVRLEEERGVGGPAQQEQPADLGATDAAASVEEREAAASTSVAAAPPPAEPAAPDLVVASGAGGAVTGALGRAELVQAPAAQAPAQLGDRSVADQVVNAPSSDVRDFNRDLNRDLNRDFNDVPSGGLAAASAPTAPAPSADLRVAERIDSAARAIEADRRRAQDPQDGVVTSAITAEPTAQRQRAANEEERDEDSVSLVVPGLEVLDVLPVGQGTTFAGMRALQRLATGDTLELVHLPGGIDPSFLEPLAPGQNQLVLQRGAGWLVMRARVPEPYLQELLQRLEGGR
jgi:hypothetical protein